MAPHHMVCGREQHDVFMRALLLLRALGLGQHCNSVCCLDQAGAIGLVLADEAEEELV